MLYVADFEGYTVDNELVPKEICMINILDPIFKSHHIMLRPYKIPQSVKDKRTASYLLNHHHHIPLFTAYDQFHLPYIPNGSIILIKGTDKVNIMKKLYTNCIVVDPFTTTTHTSFNHITHFSNVKCKFYSHGEKCALKKCYYLYNYLLNYK